MLSKHLNRKKHQFCDYDTKTKLYKIYNTYENIPLAVLHECQIVLIFLLAYKKICSIILLKISADQCNT